MLLASQITTLFWISIWLGSIVVNSLKMSKSSTIVADNELSNLRSQLLNEFVSQIKDSIAIGRSCYEQLRLIDGQELMESGQNLLVFVKSREKDFSSIFGDTPEVIDRIVSSIEQKVLICHAESDRQLINSLLKIYSRPLLQNETMGITSLLQDAKSLSRNLTMQFKVDAAKPLLYALNEQIDDSVVIAERYSAVARSMSSTQHRASSLYYYMLLSQALSDSFQGVLTSLYHFSSMMWQVYVLDSPNSAASLTLQPISARDQKRVEEFLQEQQLLITQPYFQVYFRRFKVKSKSSSFLFYVKTNEAFVLKIDNDICADQSARIASSSETSDSKDVEFTCEAYLEENSNIDIYLYVLSPRLSAASTGAAASDSNNLNGIASPPRLLAAREDTMDAFEIKLRRHVSAVAN